MSATLILGIMTALFLCFGYLGVPVAFSLMAGVFVGAGLTDVTYPALVQKIFDGMDSEALLAIPFFLLVGELMSSANVVSRITNLSLALVGHIPADCRRSSPCSACSSRKCPGRRPPTSP
jgi:TRAP-type mannitol/chloroaromatic compound transport system permease large subunit